MHVKNKKITNVTIIYICISLILLSSCSYEKMSTLMNFETDIAVSFENEDDISKFKKRLGAMGIDILSEASDNSVIEYRLRAHYDLTDAQWDALGKNFEACIVDKDDKIILRPTEVTKVSFDGVCLNVYAEDEFYEEYDETEIILTNIQIGITVYKVLPSEIVFGNDRYIEYIKATDSSEDALVKFAVACASESLSDKVEVSVKQRYKPYM